MNKKDKANAFRRLLNDDTFQLVLEEVKGEQVLVFLDPNSNGADRENAHQITVSLTKIVDYMDAVIASDIIDDKKKY